MKYTHLFFKPLLYVYCFACLALTACSDEGKSPATASKTTTNAPAVTSTPPTRVIKLTFTYGSEKKEWLEVVTQKFNQENYKLAGGEKIQVEAIPMGSGELVDEVLNGQRQAHLISPASELFIKLANAQAQLKTGKDLVSRTQNLVLSPVVIAMWQPMAEAIGWGKKPVGWADIISLANNPQGWAAYQFPQWGSFKFGQTHPEYSNSGLIALLAQVYAGANRLGGLTVEQVNQPSVAQYVANIQKSIVHYGRSTGFFADKMMDNGPAYLSAAVLYENAVIDSYKRQNLAFPIVAIYPKEGTIWSDHPVGVVEREWVTEAHRQAAEIYINYLLDKPQQQQALSFGFRPSDVSIPLSAPFDSAHGVNPQEPKTTLEVPNANVLDAIFKLWHRYKKPAHVVMVIDTSGSMSEENRIVNARKSAIAFLEMMGEQDTLSLMTFNNKLTWIVKNANIGAQREAIRGQLNALIAQGGTALYDATQTAYQELIAHPHPDKISAVVVLSDGADTNSRYVDFNQLIKNINFDSESRPVRIFTIGYGKNADMRILGDIANTSQAKSYAGDNQNILSVFKEIATFF